MIDYNRRRNVAEIQLESLRGYLRATREVAEELGDSFAAGELRDLEVLVESLRQTTLSWSPSTQPYTIIWSGALLTGS